MQDYQQRVIDEKNDLDGRVLRLSVFINGKVFAGLSADEQHLLVKQQLLMIDLSSVLSERIDNF